jgi:hypothetical protein
MFAALCVSGCALDFDAPFAWPPTGASGTGAQDASADAVRTESAAPDGDADRATTAEPKPPDSPPSDAPPLDGAGPDAGCPKGKKACGGTCVGDNQAEYGCGRAGCEPCAIPHASAKCLGGECALAACDPKWGNCNAKDDDGCETSLTTLPANGTATCKAGSCEITCNIGFTKCGTACVNIASDPSNCGACNRACSGSNVASPKCFGGLCSSSCLPGWSNCTMPAAPASDDGCESTGTCT